MYYYYNLYVACMWACVPWHTYKLKGQLCGVGSLFPPFYRYKR